MWTWGGDGQAPRERVLVVSEDMDGERKLSLGNCIDVEDTSRLVYMACLFSLKEQLLAESEVPLLIVRDIVELVEHYLPRKGRTEEEVFEAMRERRKCRQWDIDRHRIRQQ